MASRPAGWRTSALASWRLTPAPGFWSWHGRARETLAHRIEYRLVDATDKEQLLALGEGRFDALVCNMVLMDMPVIDPLSRAG